MGSSPLATTRPQPSLEGCLIWSRPAEWIPQNNAYVSPATLDDHEGDTFGEHEFVTMLSP